MINERSDHHRAKPAQQVEQKPFILSFNS